MTVYIVLLTITALISYTAGCFDTGVLASNFVFHRSLKRLGKGSRWLPAFKRVYGIKGFVMLALVEIVRDIVPILIGGVLLGFKDHADAGRAFAAFCLVMGRCYPLFYELRGKCTVFTFCVGMMFVDSSAGIAALIIAAITVAVTKYLSLGTFAGALVGGLVSVLVVDDALIRKLALFTMAAVMLQALPSVVRTFRGREEKLLGDKDITYKLNEKL